MKGYTIKFLPSQREENTIYNPGSAFASTDVGKLGGLSSGYFSLLSTASTGTALFTYEAFGIVRGIPDGTCTAKSTQRVFVTHIYPGDTISCIMSSNFSTSGTPAASSDYGKVVGLTANGPFLPGISTAGTLLTQGPIRAIIESVDSTAYMTVRIQNFNLVKMTTA